MTKERHSTITTNLVEAIEASEPIDPRGKPITYNQLIAAGRSLKVAAQQETERLARRSAVTRSRTTEFTGQAF